MLRHETAGLGRTRRSRVSPAVTPDSIGRVARYPGLDNRHRHMPFAEPVAGGAIRQHRYHALDYRHRHMPGETVEPPIVIEIDSQRYIFPSTVRYYDEHELLDLIALVALILQSITNEPE